MYQSYFSNPNILLYLMVSIEMTSYRVKFFVMVHQIKKKINCKIQFYTAIMYFNSPTFYKHDVYL